jgi:hypothetical protein
VRTNIAASHALVSKVGGTIDNVRPFHKFKSYAHVAAVKTLPGTYCTRGEGGDLAKRKTDEYADDGEGLVPSILKKEPIPPVSSYEGTVLPRDVSRLKQTKIQSLNVKVDDQF